MQCFGRVSPLVCLALLLLAVQGCSGKPETSAGPGAVGQAGGGDATPGIDPASRLDLDGGRVSVFSPAGWRRAPRSYDYLVRYQATPQLAYPSVVVLAADPPAGITEVTADDRQAFVEAIAGQLAEAGKLTREPAAVTVGPHQGVGWSAQGEAKLDGVAKPIERECLAVVISGRLYTVEAWAPRGGLDKATRAAARAVAAALSVPTLEPIEGLEPLVPPADPEPAEPADDATAPEAAAADPAE